MNKLISEGKRFENLKKILNHTAPVDVDAEGVLCLMLHCGEMLTMIENLASALEYYADDESGVDDCSVARKTLKELRLMK